jgi:DNA invertase Pin-like site-specific DNA recombinase
MRLVGYLRVSTGDQSVDSAGQRHAIERWAERSGHELSEWFADEGISGARGLDHRPGLAQAYELCRTHRRRRKDRVAGIVAFDRSRFSRDRNLAGMLRWTAQSHGFALLTVDGLNTADESMAAVASDVVSDLVGEQTRQAVRTATRAALAARRENGLVAGHVPYGFGRVGARLVPDPTEQATVARILELRAAGASLRAVAAALNAAGVRTRRGGPWSAEAVRLVASGRAAAASA